MLRLIIFTLSFFIFSYNVEAKVVGKEVSYEGDGITMKGYLAYDDEFKEKRPGILVVHEWWGHNSYARKRADMLAKLGYPAIAVDMYGDGKQANHPDEAGKFSSAVQNNIEGATKRFEAAKKVLIDSGVVDPDKIAAIGYCFGGGVVLHMARFGEDLKGVVSFHGSLGTKTPAQPGKVKAKILVCHGADDPFVSPEAVEAFKEEMENAKVDYQFISYKDTMHSFTNPDADSFGKKFNLPLKYNKESDEKSWKEMQKFFKKIFE
ncbi:MAG: dienelactone hydrolase family protein [Nitrospinae bacterium]|nr:dienelactone hydrolase family protein [Nitrospinota bacterium]